MLLSFHLEYFGECNKIIKFYSDIFNNSHATIKTFKEMPMAAAYNITGKELDMVWTSELSIEYEDSILCFEMCDSMLVAMKRTPNYNKLPYNPLICIEHHDENSVYLLFEKLYGDKYDIKKLHETNAADLHGTRWNYKKSSGCGIFYCLTFDGFCEDVISYYENVFDIKASDIVRYSDTPYAGKAAPEGADKIYSSILKFRHNNHTYALKLNDSIDSAMKGSNGYTPNDLLFYQKMYNPVFVATDTDLTYLTESFNRLQVGAKLNMPLTPTDNGDMRGGLIDRYGICWNFQYASN